VESRALSFSSAPVFQANYLYFNGIKTFDMLALNNELLLFLIHRGEPRRSGQRM